MRRRETKVLQEFLRIAGLTKPILHANKFLGGRVGLGEELCNRAPEPASNLMLFKRHDRAALARGSQDGLLVQRFHGMTADDPTLNFLSGELFGRKQSLV